MQNKYEGELERVSVCDGCWELEFVSVMLVGCECSWEMADSSVDVTVMVHL